MYMHHLNTFQYTLGRFIVSLAAKYTTYHNRDNGLWDKTVYNERQHQAIHDVNDIANYYSKCNSYIDNNSALGTSTVRH